MTPDELRAIMDHLRDRVHLRSRAGESPVVITFYGPTEEAMLAAGLNADGVKRILRVPWWGEMVEDIVETPEMCEPDESADQVLVYAKDVITEYIRKRFPLEGE